MRVPYRPQSGRCTPEVRSDIVTVWQMPLEDAGLLGADKGAGGIDWEGLTLG